MSIEVKVPVLGESIVEGTLAKWLVAVGQTVAAGAVLAELETDKVNIEVSAPSAGVLTAILKNEGDSVAVGELIATLDATAPATTTVSPVAAEAKVATAPVAVTGKTDTATPVARNVAAESGVDLRTVAGSGPSGKITKQDVINASVTTSPPAASQAPVLSTPAAPRSETRVKMSRRRQTIAQRLVLAQQTAAMLTTFNEVDLTRVMDIRKRKKDTFKEQNAIGLGFMSFFTKATVSALKAFPAVNSEIQGDEVVYKNYYDIGIAVSTDDGLVVPVLRDADGMSFAGIEKGIDALARRARENKLGLSDLVGGTFTITNGGVFGSLMSTPILNAPQVAILGMHKIQERPVVVNGQIVIRPMMYLALSYDHRIIDGSTAVRFLVHIKDMLEDPDAMLLQF
jgi:2-oxoglutarate dehydrogenase E2 component (dihydrolipoamide succinyltransferase)